MEGVYVGCRYYDKAGAPLCWPFGLSYTEFAYSDLTATADGARHRDEHGHAPRRGGRAVYIAAPQDGLHRPLRELKGFEKVFLQPGESKTVSFPLNDRSFAVWQRGWKVPGGATRCR